MFTRGRGINHKVARNNPPIPSSLSPLLLSMKLTEKERATLEEAIHDLRSTADGLSLHCSKGVPTLKQLRHFGYWARKCPSMRASSPSALLFLTPSNSTARSPISLSKEYDSSKTWRSVRLAS